MIVVVVALAVPPALESLRGVSAAQADAVSTARATALASAVLEHVVADVSSTAPGLGFAALESPGTYVDGLRARLADVTGAYEDAGLTFDVSIGGLVSWTGASSGEADQDVFRAVTVDVSFPAARGGTQTLSLSVMLTDMSA